MIEVDKLLWEFRSEIIRTNNPIQNLEDAAEEEDYVEHDEVISETSGNSYIRTSADRQREWDRERAKHELTSVKQTILNARISLQQEDSTSGLSSYHIGNLRRRVNELGVLWNEEIKRELEKEVAKIREEGLALADEYEVAWHTRSLDMLLTRAITTPLAMQNTLKQLNDIEAILVQKDSITELVKQKIRAARERAVRYRATKKLADAELAIGVGLQGKADKLRKEAIVMFAQDWALAFPGEDPPTL